jgi:hypothetical protein
MLKLINMLEKRSERCRLNRVENEDFEGVIFKRRPAGDGDVPWLVFDEEVEKAHELGEVVFVPQLSNSGKSWCLRCSPPEGRGRIVKIKDVEYTWRFREVKLGSGPTILFDEGLSAEPCEAIYVRRLRGKTFEEAHANAVELIKSWGLPPIVFELESENFVKNYTSVEAREMGQAFDRWFEAIGNDDKAAKEAFDEMCDAAERL